MCWLRQVSTTKTAASPRKEWAELKPTTPFGYLPLLETDGKKIQGSMVIARYLAEKLGVAGADALENAEIASAVDLVEGLGTKMGAVYGEKDENKKKELKKEFAEEVIPKILGDLEKFSSQKEGDFLYGKKVTYLDFLFFCMSDYMLKENSNVLEKFPLLAKARESVEALPNVAKWLEKRPKTEY